MAAILVPLPLSSATPSPLVLCRPDRVGDVLIATACLQPVRLQHPGLPVYFVAREVMRPLLEGHPLLEGFIGLPPDRRVRTLTAELRAVNAAAMVHFHPDRSCQVAAWLAGVSRRLGYRSAAWLDWTLTDSFADARRTGLRHEALYDFELLAAVGIKAPALETLRPSVHLDERWRDSLRALTGASADGVIVLNPTAHSMVHRWPAEHFAWVATELSKAGYRIALVGETAHDFSVAALRALLEPHLPDLLDLSGKLNLAELGWLLRSARLLVSRNTGTTHLAAAVGCPTVELFGRLEPTYGAVRWASLGDQVRAVTCPPLERRRGESKRTFWRRGYAAIPREDVLQAARDLLAEGAPR